VKKILADVIWGKSREPEKNLKEKGRNGRDEAIFMNRMLTVEK
jgi:hypothetical protein